METRIGHAIFLAVCPSLVLNRDPSSIQSRKNARSLRAHPEFVKRRPKKCENPSVRIER